MCICAALAMLKLLRCQALCKPYTVDVEKANSSYLHYMEKISFLYLFLEWKAASGVAEGYATVMQKTGCSNEHGW